MDTFSTASEASTVFPRLTLGLVGAAEATMAKADSKKVEKCILMDVWYREAI